MADWQKPRCRVSVSGSQMRLDAAELMIRKAAWMLDNDMPCGAEANMAKWLAADAGFLAADQAVQTHGGFGYAREYHVERYWREARLRRSHRFPKR